ncbi:hypothetical protein D3C72_1588940 [compost metagenome]
MKKCTPQKRDFRSASNPSDNSVIDRPEVLVAKIACEARCGATFLYRSCFQSMRSAIASITRSHSLSSAMSSS